MTDKTAPAQTWTHKGVKIEFASSNATFTASDRGRNFRAPSLDAIKKKIDSEQKFESFPCYVEMQGWGWNGGLKGVAAFFKGQHRGERALIEAMAVGIEKSRRESGSAEFRVRHLDSRGKETEITVYAVLPRTASALATWKMHWEENEACAQAEHVLSEANKAKLSPLHAAMPYRRASEEG